MDYEKKYKEALERAKGLYSQHNVEWRDEDIEYIFPELAEGEDEKIRKEIITYLSTVEDKELIPYESWIAWLEKQGEQKPVKASYTTIVETGNGGVNACVTRELSNGEQKPADKKGMNLVEEEMTPFQKKVFFIIDTTIEEEQGLKQVCDELLALASNEIEQKPVKKTAVYPPTLDKAIDLYYFSYGNGKGGFDNLFLEKFRDIVKTFVKDYGEQKPVFEMKTPEESLGVDSDTYNKIVDECIYGEQKPAGKVEQKPQRMISAEAKEALYDKPVEWSEEDEETLKGIIYDISCVKRNNIDKTNLIKVYDKELNWLNSIKKRFVSENKQGWDENDEARLTDILCKVKDDLILNKDEKDWLNSLRPQKQWKPSDEQMNVLNEVLNFTANHKSPHWNDYIFGTLNNLIRQLKKLREE